MRIIDCMNKAGITPERLAQETGIDVKKIEALATGDNCSISTKSLLAIAAALNTTVEDLTANPGNNVITPRENMINAIREKLDDLNLEQLNRLYTLAMQA